jgi:ribosomal protein S4
MKKKRLDVHLFEERHFPSRERAKSEIMSGNVLVDDILQDKPGYQVKPEAQITIKEKTLKYVSRGGVKIEKAAEIWNIDFSGKMVCDIGASTGGFTDFALQNGAEKVYAIDVGYGQLDYKLRNDSRVVNMERVNVRYLFDDKCGKGGDGPRNTSQHEGDKEGGRSSQVEEAIGGDGPRELGGDEGGRSSHLSPLQSGYSLINLGLMFFVFSFVGKIWEIGVLYFQEGVIVNRGSLYGPWIPIYGTGGVAVIILLSRIKKRPILTFFMAMLVCSVIEFSAAKFLETAKHLRYWNYNGYFFNIEGDVCLEGAITFGVLCMIGIYLIAPRLDNVFCKFSMKKRQVILAVLSVGFLSDFVLTLFHPHVGKFVSR